MELEEDDKVLPCALGSTSDVSMQLCCMDVEY